MLLIPELAIERWLFHDGLSVNDGRLVALAPAVEEATGIRDRLLEELAASGLDADRALDRALNEAAEAFRSQPPDSMSRQRRCASRSKRRRLVGRLARRCLRRCDADLSEGRCESRSTVWVGRPHGAGFVGALVQHARDEERRPCSSPQAAASVNLELLECPVLLAWTASGVNPRQPG